MPNATHGGPTAPGDFSEDVAERWRTFAADVRRRLDAGGALDPSTRAGFERALGGGVDLGGAELHPSAFAGALAERVGADAFTAGQRVYGGPARVAASSQASVALVGHELMHAAQQASGSGGPFIQRATDGDAQEEQAVSVERAMRAMTDQHKPGATFTQADVDVIADRVLRIMRDRVVNERERSPMLAPGGRRRS